MMATDETTQQILTKCSRMKVRDYRNLKRTSIGELENLLSKLENGKSDYHHTLKPLIHIIETLILSIDRKTLWKSNGKLSNHQQKLAELVCRLFKCLCQIDAECAASNENKIIIYSILQWLRDDTDFHITRSISQDLHLSIYSCIENYSLICKNQEDFLDELFSVSSSIKKQSSSSSSIRSCFGFHHHEKKSINESLSIIDYSSRLVIYLLESSLVSSSLLINQILSFFLIYAPIRRFSIYLVNHTDFYRTIIVPLLSEKNSDHFIQCIIDETARSQTDSNDRVFVFTHIINLLSEFVLHSDIEVQTCSFIPTLKHLFDSLVDCGTTVPLWYLVKCLSNLLTSASKEMNIIVQEMNRIGLINSIVNYTSTLIQKSTLGEGKMVLKLLHNNVLISCLSMLYNISTLVDEQILNKDLVANKICQLLFKSDVQKVRIMSCLLYSNLLTQKELEVDDSCHHLCEQLFSSMDQAFKSSNYYLSNQISLLILVNCLKKLCIHKQFQIRIGKQSEYIELLFQILRSFNSSIEQQEEIQSILQSIWFLSFEYSCAKQIHSHDKYFALLVQLAETNSNETIQQAAKGILWQLKQTISIKNGSTLSIRSESCQHIMFSYNHDSKDLVNQICQNLQNSGYRTWMDVDNMHGSTLDCMAHAIEQARLIIICISEKYKQSPNCQSEAEYAYRLRKPIVPILLQAKYKPDGWLGIVLGTKLYIDFTKNDFESNYKKLVKEIEITKN